MKKLITIVLAALMLVACGGGTGETLDAYMVTRAKVLSDMVQGFAGNESYTSMYTNMGELNEPMEEISASLGKMPESAVVLDLPQNVLEMLAQNGSDPVQLDLDEDQREYMLRRSMASLPNMLNSQHGAYMIAATSILQVSESYVAHPEQKQELLFLFYDGDWCTCTSFAPSQEGTVMVSTLPVKLDEDTRQLLENGRLYDALDIYGTMGITTRKISGEELEKLLPAGQ